MKVWRNSSDGSLTQYSDGGVVVVRGQLRVYLGSAPGVGKTFKMLDEGWRRRERGTDVVIGYVETHRRPRTEAQIRDIEIVPRTTRDYRGALLEEMDLEAVLVRAPEVVLVDELAHTNVPGGRNEKRWQDVEELLAAGIDVITTVNIQHLESVNDVVEKITGVAQQETVPDVVVRRASQIEMVDITPEALRRRMEHGNIYSSDKIDASLSNYFRVGNLSALRELALLWLADRVEDAMLEYQKDHNIDATWETRERLIVGVSCSKGDEILLRRAARMASRTGAEVIAVHVVKADGLHGKAKDSTFAQRLTGEFDGRFEEIVSDDVAAALVSVARSEHGTQIVLGARRRRTFLRPFGGVVPRVLRRARDLDVHVIAVGDDRRSLTRERSR
jgi:two-component system sensor histidine kinase KdpD